MLLLQGSLLDLGEPELAPLRPERRELGDGAWVEHQAGWLGGSDEVFERMRRLADWGQRDRPMYGEMVATPRLTSWSPVDELPAELAVVRRAAAALEERHGVPFPRVGSNLYRDGRDSVAWHGDREDGLVAIVSVGERRTFRMRPKGGGASLSWRLGRGDLLVMGGTCQRTWEHTVPKSAAARGPRISITIRTGTLDQPWFREPQPAASEA